MMPVYFIQSVDGGPIKIGYSGNVSERLASLQIARADVLKVLATNNEVDEAEVQARFKHLHIRGEWYRPREELLRYIAEKPSGKRRVDRWGYPVSKYFGRSLKATIEERKQDLAERRSQFPDCRCDVLDIYDCTFCMACAERQRQ
jgi:Meiotically up-regulated gene 113